MSMNSTHCFYQPPASAGYAMGCVVDFINPETGLSACGGSTQQELAARYPGIEVWLIDAAVEFREQVGRTEPEEITPEQWMQSLECLPPNNWHRKGIFECFQSCEHYSGRLTATYLRRGQRAWVFKDIAGMSIDAIIERVRVHLAAQHAANATAMFPA